MVKQISEATHSDRDAVVIIDSAGWHTDDISPQIPPYSLELNPTEKVWQWLRQHCLANRCFEGYNDIVEPCCSAWNTFIHSKDSVKSLCTRGWAKVVKI